MLKTTMSQILLLNIALIICINFKFLYNCFVKCEIIHKTQLIINVINFCQLYKKRKITPQNKSG